jgi:hypothetical protein
MNQALHHVLRTASRGTACVAAAAVQSGMAPGLVVIDSNRPAMNLAAARGLLKQFGAAH